MIDLTSPQLYFNRELSWLKFNSRVLAQSLDETLPPLERLKFLAIYGTNLDEFYMIRVAGLKSLYKARVQETGPDKLTPGQQLEAIRNYLHEEQIVLENCYRDILSLLHDNGVDIKPYKRLGKEQKREIKSIFFEQIYPGIIPIAIDATHPFPHLNNLSFGLALTLVDSHDNLKHGLIRIPRILPRFIQVGQTFVPIESVVENYIKDLFPGYTKLASTPFRVTRNADIAIEEEEADDFMEILEEGLKLRKKGEMVRLEIGKGANEELVKFFNTHAHIFHNDIYYFHTFLNLGSLWQIAGNREFAHLTLPSFKPRILPPLSDNESLYNILDKQDVMMYHPYESFEPVVKLIPSAAKDPDVVSIKMTLYRSGTNSPIVQSLMSASESGKQVTVMVELKARFDEKIILFGQKH